MSKAPQYKNCCTNFHYDEKAKAMRLQLPII